MVYQVTARKWRPRNFDEVVAQEHITTTLKNAILSGRIAQCYLLCGPRGVGKTTTARILAKALNCAARQGADPCDECDSCRSIAAGTSMNVLEIDGASNNSVDDVRELREVVRYVATEGTYKIYIIDEVHMLSTAAFNALLKTLEEPPPHVVFIFATTEVQAVPETILSRCQRFNFRRVPSGRIAEHLQKIARAEGIEADERALFTLASRADGALRDAESLFDQVASLGRIDVEAVEQVLGLVDRGLYFELVEALRAAEPARVLAGIAAAIDAGADIEEFAQGLVELLRHLLFARVQGSAAGLDVADSERGRCEELASAFAVEDLLRMLQSLIEVQAELRRSLAPRFRLEVVLVRLALMGRAVDVGELLLRLKALEESQAGGRRGPPALPSPPATSEGAGAPPAASVPSSPAGAPPASPAAAGGLDLEAVRAGWGQLLEAVRREQPALARFLGETRLLALEGRVLRLEFGPQDRFPMRQVVKNRESIERLCAEQWGEALRLDCVVADGGGEESPQDAAAPQGNPAVRSVLDTFDGELL